MASKPPLQPTGREAFVVRLWRETSSDSDWRGQVVHVRSGRTEYVQGLDELMECIRNQTEQAKPPQTGLR